MKRLLGLLLFAMASWAQNPATAKFPGAVATDTDLGVLCNSAHSTLTADIGSTDTAISVASGAAFCAPGYVTLDAQTGSAETVKICSIAANTLNVCAGGRAVHGAAAAHSSGANADGFLDQNYFNQAFAEIKAMQAGLGANFANVRLVANPVPWGSLSGVPSSFAPAAHASTHAQGGGDALSGMLSVNITGNAGTVTNGVYTTGGPYSDPPWLSISKAKVGLGNVENTPLSTWTGGASITTLGTISSGTVPWARLSSVPSSFAPSAHASTHVQGGSDALAGTLAVNITGNAGTVTNGIYTSGSYSDPYWLSISKGKVGLGNVENTALSTWAGSTNITTLGTISSAVTVHGTIHSASGGFQFPDGTTQITAGGGISTQNVVTSSRASGTVYQNSTGKPMFVSASFCCGNSTLVAYTDGNSSPSTVVAAQGTLNTVGQANITFWVLPGNYYKITNPGASPLTYWTEWY